VANSPQNQGLLEKIVDNFSPLSTYREIRAHNNEAREVELIRLRTSTTSSFLAPSPGAILFGCFRTSVRSWCPCSRPNFSDSDGVQRQRQSSATAFRFSEQRQQSATAISRRNGVFISWSFNRRSNRWAEIPNSEFRIQSASISRKSRPINLSLQVEKPPGPSALLCSSPWTGSSPSRPKRPTTR